MEAHWVENTMVPEFMIFLSKTTTICNQSLEPNVNGLDHCQYVFTGTHGKQTNDNIWIPTFPQDKPVTGHCHIEEVFKDVHYSDVV